MFIDISPLKKNRDYRLLFIGQTISYLGNMVSYVAVPYQIYHLTRSNFMVGLVSAVQFIPVLVFGLYGGSVADRIDRRRLLIYAETIMCVAALGLTLNALLPAPSTLGVFVLVFILQAASSYHRPAMEAMTQKMIPKEDFPAIASLSSFKYGVTAIIGPAFGGWMIYKVGLFGAYIFDLLTFVLSLVTAFLISKNYYVTPSKEKKNFIRDIRDGIDFARSNQTLFGSYIVDIVAMTFAFPVALFPAMAEGLSEKVLGALYAAMAVGTLVTLSFGELPSRSLYRGRAIALAAAAWGLAVIAFGVSPSIYLGIFFLVLAGAADTVSGLHRRIVWNEIIPNNMRGRLAGIEMISYMSGPLLGNFRAGTMASFSTVPVAVTSGGVICVAAIAYCAWKLPIFWNYVSPETTEHQ